MHHRIVVSNAFPSTRVIDVPMTSTHFLANKTVITIAHRLSTIQSAEYIYVLEDGMVVDSGSPAELLSKDKSYFAQML